MRHVKVSVVAADNENTHMIIKIFRGRCHDLCHFGKGQTQLKRKKTEKIKCQNTNIHTDKKRVRKEMLPQLH